MNIKVTEEQVTEEQVENWLGSDWKYSQFIELITELSNGEYEQEQMRKDILDSENEE